MLEGKLYKKALEVRCRIFVMIRICRDFPYCYNAWEKSAEISNYYKNHALPSHSYIIFLLDVSKMYVRLFPTKDIILSSQVLILIRGD